MSGGSKEVTVGYKYYLGMHMALCHGPIDKITRIEVDRRIAWEGVNEGGSIAVSADNLFGGDSREGGISGTVSIAMGDSDQESGSYLEAVLGEDIPAFRGVTCAVLEQCYVGNNPYLKPWAFRAQRIHTTSNGALQWYDARSEIGASGNPECAYDCDAFYSYLLAEYENPALFNYPETPIPVLQESYQAGIFDGGEFTLIPAQDFVGQGLNLWGQSSSAYQRWRVDEVFPRCGAPGAVRWGVAVYGNSANFFGPGFFLNRNGSGSDGGVAFVFAGGLSNGYDPFRPIYRLSNPITWARTGFGNFGSNGTAQILWSSSQGLGIQVGSSPVWYGFPGFQAINFMSVNLTVLTYPIRLTETSWEIRVSATASVTLNGVSYSESADRGTLTAIVSSGGTVTPISDTKTAQLFEGMRVRLAAVTGISEGFDVDAAYQEFLRNFPDYQSPEGCGCPSMNPAHIIRECLTDNQWGMGYSGSDIDDDSFAYAADYLFNEGMGISLIWSQEMPLEDFIAEILRHIDGVLYVSRVTGKFILKLIRDDYDLSSLVTLNESNISVMRDARRPAVGELVASLTVNYWDSETGETGSVTEHNQALYQIQTGGGGSTTIQYPGFTSFNLAARVARRDLQALSTPLLSCVIEVNRDAELLNIGDAFSLDWPDLGISGQVMRVQQMSLGDGRKNTVTIDAVEDVFALPGSTDVGVSNPDQGLWEDPAAQLPLLALPRIVEEVPYYELAQREGDTNANQVLDDDSDAGFLLYAAGRQQNELNTRVDIDSGSGYVETDAPLDFAPYAYLLSDVGYTDTTIYVTAGKDLDLVTVGTVAQINNELVRVDSVDEDSTGTFVTVGRGVLDTVPAEHTLDSTGFMGADGVIVFWGSGADTDEVQYALSDEVNVRMRPVLGANVLPSDQAPVDSYTFNSRAIRPYPPGDLRVDGISYPDPDDSSAAFYTGAHSITWAHRDRLQQTGGEIFDYLTGDIGPEAGTTYLVEAYSTLVGGTVTDPWLSVNVGSDTFYEQDSNTDSNISEAPTDSDRVHFRVTSLRDGYQSWQSPEVTLVYEQIDSDGIDSDGVDSSGALWTPAEITTALWLDAADAGTITESSGAVSQWDDKSVEGYSFTQGTSSRRPTILTAELNGLDVFDFDGGDSLVASNIGIGRNTSRLKCFFVCKPDNATTDRRLFNCSTGTSTINAKLLIGVGRTSGKFNAGGRRTDGGSFAESATSASADTSGYSVYMADFNYGAASLTQDINAAQDSTGVFLDAGSTSDTDSQRVGIGANTIGDNIFFDGKIAEILFVEDDANEDEIWGYLHWRWGLEANLPSGHPYEFGPPTI